MSSPIPGWLRNRWLLGGLALAAFALFAWFTGDLVALGGARPFETEGGRAALIAFVAAACLVGKGGAPGAHGWRMPGCSKCWPVVARPIRQRAPRGKSRCCGSVSKRRPRSCGRRASRVPTANAA